MRKYKLISILVILSIYISNVFGYIEPDFELESEATVIYNIDFDQYVYSDKGEEILYPASITKVMTALVILNNTIDYNEKITITYEMLDGLAAANASVMGLRVGEVISIKDLLYGLLLPSGADAANALAYYNSHKIDAFVNEMNRTADKLGCTNTSFMNPTGLDHVKNYTTAKDLVLIMKEALKYDLFKEIISTNNYTTEPTNKHPKGITLKSTNAIRDPKNVYYSPYVLGGKTGYTTLAQRTYVRYGMTDNGLSYIVVSLKSPFEGYYATSKCFKDQGLIYDWLNEHFSSITLKLKDDYYDTYKIVHSFTRDFDALLMNDLEVLIDDTMTSADFTYKARVLDEYEATIVEGQFIGYLDALNSDEEVVSTVSLKTATTVKKNTIVIVCEQIIDLVVEYFVEIIIIAVVMFVLSFILNMKKHDYDRKRKQELYTKRRLKELREDKE